MTLPLATPGKCCGHNLNMHSGSGLEGTCIICSCVGFEPDTCYSGHAKGCEHMAIGLNELRQCRAVLHSETEGDLRCQGEVTEQTSHLGDHWTIVDIYGNKVHWTEAVAVYPAASPDRTVVGSGSARYDQVGGDHYKLHKVQPWDIWQEYGLDAFTGAIIKYLLRDKGNRLQDLKKARHTLDRLIEIEEGK